MANNTVSMGDGDNGNHATDAAHLYQRGLEVLQVLLLNNIDPLTSPLDLLVVGLVHHLCLRAATDLTPGQIIDEQKSLTAICASLNIGPLRDLAAARRRRLDEAAEGVSK